MKITFQSIITSVCVSLVFLATTTKAVPCTNTVYNLQDSGPGSLRYALTNANNGDVITFCPTVTGTIFLTNGPLMVTKSVSILGPGPGSLAVNGNYPHTTNRVFYVTSNLVVSIFGLTITNGFVSALDDAAGIQNDHANLTVSNCVFSGNQGGFGGAIATRGATLLVSSSTFISNSAAYTGAAIDCEAYEENGTVSVSNSTFIGNYNVLGFQGGAIYNSGIGTTNATLVVNNCTFGSNSTDGGEGGAIANLGFGTATVISSTFTNNLASLGGALANSGGGPGNATLTVSNCTISGNSANSGGGLYNSTANGVATILVLNSTISGNSLLDPNLGNGGGIFSDGGTVTILNTTLNGNFGPNGGGIYNDGDDGNATLTVSNCAISANSASFGGGIFNSGLGGVATAHVFNSTINGNFATNAGVGGAIYNAGNSPNSAPLVVVLNSTISGNSGVSGGGIFNDGDGGNATATILNTTLNANSATDGGGIYNRGVSGSATLNIGSTILNAGASGGNIFNDGTVISLGYNLSSDNGGGFLTGTADQTNTNPRLGPLQNNGGPTFTHGLLAGSPAVDAGTNFNGLAFDQRGTGFARTVDINVIHNAGDGTDIGAFELQSSEFWARLAARPSFNTNGFGWVLNGDTVNGGPNIANNVFALTDGASGENRSGWFGFPLYVGAFEASFTYQDIGGGGADGVGFVIQNDPRGTTALGLDGGGLGYSDITQSLGFLLNIYSGSPGGASGWMLGTNGVGAYDGSRALSGMSYQSTAPVNLDGGNPIAVALRYTGGILQVSLIDTVTSANFQTNIPVNIPAFTGTNVAWVGITGTEGGVLSYQTVSNFSYVPLPALAISSQPGSLVFTWPAVIYGFKLQSNTNLNNAAGWAPVAATVTQTNDLNQVIIPRPTGPQFYRLVLP